MRKEIDYWFEQAKADFKSATDLLNTDNFYASVFFSQQTAEKSLKSLYIKEKKTSVKTHNLVFLARELDAPQNVINDCAELTPDYITTRYPDAAIGAPFESYTGESAQRHLRMAREVLQWVETMLLMK
ncbi:MAG TPA: HEPN domain-containing protein [Candidatus Methanoperedens sp.]